MASKSEFTGSPEGVEGKEQTAKHDEREGWGKEEKGFSVSLFFSDPFFLPFILSQILIIL